MNIKNRKFFIVVVAVILLFNFSSCSKYEDGPSMSLRTKKARLTGEWELQEIDGNNVSGEEIWEFVSDGDFEATYEDDGDKTTNKGEWTWEDEKEKIEIDIDDGGKFEMEILRLTNSELIMEDDDGDEYEFEKQ